MDQATFDKEMDLNRQAYESMQDQIRHDYAGKHVAFVHGKLMGPFDDFDQGWDAVQGQKPAPECFLLFPADSEPIFEPVEVTFDLSGINAP